MSYFRPPVTIFFPVKMPPPPKLPCAWILVIRILPNYRVCVVTCNTLWGGTKRGAVTVKVKVQCTLVQALRLCTGPTAHRESTGPFMTTALEGVRGQRHALAALYPREKAGTHCTGGWVGPRVGLDGCGKSLSPQPGFDPRTVQPVAQSLYPQLPGPL